MAKRNKRLATSARIESENYRTTVLALHIFADFLKQGNAAAFHSIGRKMTTSERNLVSKRHDQTPDLVVQVSEREGYVCEAKTTMADNENGWDDHVKQILKYDDELEGWWTITLKLSRESNTILLVCSQKSIKFKKYLEESIRKGSVTLHNPLAFVGFNQTSTPEESMLYQLDYGTVYNKDLHSALEDRQLIPIEKFVAAMGELKFYDSPPPVEYMMETLWNHLFNELKSKVPFDEATKSWAFEVAIHDITEQLQNLYGQKSSKEREVSFPQHNWVKDALEHFEVIGLAKRKTHEEYTILYRQLRGDLLERFGKAKKKMKEKTLRKKQEVLFPGETGQIVTAADQQSATVSLGGNGEGEDDKESKA